MTLFSPGSTQQIRRRKFVMGSALMLPVVSATRLAAAASSDTQEGLSTLIHRLQAHYRTTVNAAGAEVHLRSQAGNGRWADIDLSSTANPAWPPEKHMHRLRLLAVAWANPRHTLSASPSALTGIERGLGAWLQAAPRSVNWWFNSIGPQLALMPVLVLTQGHLDADLARQARSLLVAPDEVPKAQARGQNLIWYGTQWLVRGALAGEPLEVAAASARLQAELAIGGAEGIQHDFSFHQHGPQLYTGGYGLGFLMDSSQIATWLQGTPWAYDPNSLLTLSRYALDGMRPLVRGTWLDWGARGREFTRIPAGVSLPQALRPAIQRLSTLVAAHEPALSAFAGYLGQVGQGLVGAPVVENRHFWRSDFMVHQRPVVYFSVKTASSRTVGTESGNSENLLGYWTPMGCNYILRRGDEYDGLPPVWDWSRLPGTTAPAFVPRFEGLLRHDERFVGAVSDGVDGIMAMHLKTAHVRAKKAWFFNGDTMVALGCDIHSESTEAVATTLNQTRARGALQAGVTLLSEGGGALALEGWHDGLHYASLDGQKLSFSRQRRTGDGRRINLALGGGTAEAELVLIAIEHGLRPNAARYAYAVAPDTQTGTGASRPSTLINDPAVQSVQWPSDGLLMAVFHQPGSVMLDPGTRLSVDSACLLMIRRVGRVWRAQVSEPTGSRLELVLSLERDGKQHQSMTVVLPKERSEIGRTVFCKDIPAV